MKHYCKLHPFLSTCIHIHITICACSNWFYFLGQISELPITITYVFTFYSCARASLDPRCEIWDRNMAALLLHVADEFQGSTIHCVLPGPRSEHAPCPCRLGQVSAWKSSQEWHTNLRWTQRRRKLPQTQASQTIRTLHVCNEGRHDKGEEKHYRRTTTLHP